MIKNKKNKAEREVQDEIIRDYVLRQIELNFNKLNK